MIEEATATVETFEQLQTQNNELKSKVKKQAAALDQLLSDRSPRAQEEHEESSSKPQNPFDSRIEQRDLQRADYPGAHQDKQVAKPGPP